MRTLRINHVLKDKVLVSRESARLVEDAIRAVTTGDADPESAYLTLDFAGVEGIAPSFMDEMLTIIEAVIQHNVGAPDGFLIVANPPTRLSSKFEAIARGHAMSVRMLPDGSWMFARHSPANR